MQSSITRVAPLQATPNPPSTNAQQHAPTMIKTDETYQAAHVVTPWAETPTSTQPIEEATSIKQLDDERGFGHIAWWVALLLLHLANIAYYVLVAIFYHQLPATYLNMKIEQLAIAMPSPYYSRIIFAHAFVASVHVLMVALMLVGSLTSKRLVYYPSHRVLGSVVRFASHHLSLRATAGHIAQTKHHSIEKLLLTPLRWSVWLANYFFGASGVFGVNGSYFEWIAYAREALESALQTYQAYRMTLLLPRPWLNRGYVGLLASNSLAIPLVHKLYHDQPRKRRLFTLLIDAVLDIASSIGVPIILFIAYAKQYTDPSIGFPLSLWLDDLWVNHVMHEFQLMMVASPSDLLSRIVFAFGLLLCMDGIKDLLMLPPNVMKVESESAEARHTSSLQLAIEKRGGVTKVASKIINGVFVIWGLGVVAIHIAAEAKSTNDACRLQLRPWFGTKPACAILEIDCSLIDSRGHGEVMDKAWTRFDAEMIFQVTVRHCTELHVSPAILSFNNLDTFKVYNSTVESWMAAAALETRFHPSLKFVYIVRTNFTNGELPAGVLSSDFPKTMAIFGMCVSNIKSIPDDVDTKWPHGQTIMLEFIPLDSVPQSIIRLEPYALSVAGTQITSLPVEMLGIPGNQYIHIGGTPIKSLPRTVPKLSPTLWSFRMSKTKIAVLWKWMDPLIQRAYARVPYPALSALGTPLCAELAEIVAGSRSQFSTNESDLAVAMDVSTSDRLKYTSTAITCASAVDSYYPLAFEDYQQKQASLHVARS